MKIAKNVAMLEIEAQLGCVYPTLTWGKGHLVLIDAGFPGQAELIKDAIANEGFRPEDLTEIILTHQDIDHIGCVLDMLRLAPAAKVMAHVDEAKYIDGRETPIKLAAMLANLDRLPPEQKAWFENMREGFANRRIAIDKTLTDGEVLPICGGIEVVFTPGHTPGHICLYLRESKVMVGGDELNITDGELSGPNPAHTFDEQQGILSFKKVKAFDISSVVSYHCGLLEL